MASLGGRRQWQGGRFDEEEDDSEYSGATGQQSSSRNTTSSGGGNRSSVGPPPTFNGDRSAGVWEEYKIRARLWLMTTTIEEKARGPRLLQALTGHAFELMKHMAESDEWLEDPENGKLLLEEMGKPSFFGKEELESLWGALQKLFFTKLRTDDDDMVTFRNKFEDAVRKVKRHKVELPSQALGFLYLKQLRVDGFTLERVITMTNGDLTLDSVITATRKLKMRLLEEAEDKKKHMWIQELQEEIPQFQDHEDDQQSGDVELKILEGALQELDGDADLEPITETEAKDVLMNLIKQKVTGPVQNMSYKQVQNAKQDLRNARGFRAVQGYGKGRHKGKDLDYLKSITTCRRCLKVGHWHRECPNPPARESQSPSMQAQSGSSSGTSATRQGWWAMCESISEEGQSMQFQDSHVE